MVYVNGLGKRSALDVTALSSQSVMQSVTVSLVELLQTVLTKHLMLMKIEWQAMVE